jgi:hypothetical protein
MNIDFLYAVGHSDHGEKLFVAYRTYITAMERLLKMNCPRFDDKTEDVIEDLHQEIKDCYAEYVNAYDKFCKAYRNNFDLIQINGITAKPWEPENAKRGI